MSKLETIEAEVRKLPPEQAMQLQDWLANYLEDEAELSSEFVASIERGQADLKVGFTTPWHILARLSTAWHKGL